MSDLFASLLHRHKGTCDVVKPRRHSRFEAETAMPLMSAALNAWETDETREEITELQEPGAQAPDHRSPDTQVQQRTPLRIEVKENRPVDHPSPVHPENDNPNPDFLIGHAPDISPVVEIHGQVIKPNTNIPLTDKRDEAPVKPASVGRKTMVERIGTPPLESIRRLDDKFDRQISAMLDRIATLPSNLPPSQEGVHSSERVPSDGEANAGGILEVATIQPRQKAPIDDGPAKTNGTDTNGLRQQKIASDHRNPAKNTLLAPPSWFSEMQAHANLQKNKSNSKPPPQPVVHVTIGRIEIKAIKPKETPRARKPQKPSGVMSLEKYLHQSRRGGR